MILGEFEPIESEEVEVEVEVESEEATCILDPFHNWASWASFVWAVGASACSPT